MTTENVVEPGGFWRRFAAVILDAIILSLIQFPITAMLGFLSMQAGGHAVDQFLVQMLSFVAGLIAAFLYYGLFYSLKGASPGKMAMGLKVVDARTGEYLSIWRAFFREVIGKLVSAAVLFIGYLMVPFRGDKRALHDLLFETQVIRSKPENQVLSPKSAESSATAASSDSAS